MTHILCLETATTNCSVSVARNGETIALVEQNEKGYSHSENLHIFIQEALNSASLALNDLDAVAISKGPGSYTGLRIGVSAAKGLCYGLEIPLIAIPTLTLLAQKLSVENGYIMPMLDARRLEVYTAVFSSNKEMIKDTWAEVLTENSFNEYLTKDKVHFIGNCIDKAQTVIQHENAIFFESNSYPSAQEMGQLAQAKFLAQQFEDVAYFEPYYLKDFVANKSKK